MTIRSLVENKTSLDYQALTSALISEFGISDPVNWEAVIPANVQQDLFGGETLRLFDDHPNFKVQKDIRTIVLKKGNTSQLLILFAKLKDVYFSKANIEKITKRFIGGQAAERYVVWFIGNNSNTEFKVVLSGREGKRIILKTLPFAVNQPYYKTYDFIINEVRNRASGFFVEPTDLWQALWKSFDISVVNKKFYLDIKTSFDALLNNSIFQGSIRIEEARKQFVVRLLGRIIFCWFLKKIKIISEDVLSSNAVSRYENYYLEFLEILFFEVFNTPKGERGNHPDEIKDYPFLNGGLFEAQVGDYGDYQGYVFIKNEWFLNLFKNTLEKYNFTIDENTSSSSEIAIDPEMLGRIFENLLAEQNPETHESARKSTGSYYTPREIVDYMVEQSISEYLKSNLNSSDSQTAFIDDFIHTETLPEELKPYSKEILENLNKVKVLDPACGSGAFPIGMLQKLIALKLQLSPFTIGGNTKGVYDLKLQTILNSIYGCDIQPMAVELSRLRCWLSLIIDEEVDKKKTNWGIANLPNLDFKFVCVNTLINLPQMVADSLGTSADDFNKLKELRKEFFTASAKRKIKIENDFKALQNHIAEKQREWSTGNTKAVTMLINWNPFSIEKTDWFDPFWMFGIKDGFDVAIGNPPYKVSIDKVYKKIYSESIFGRPNLYGFFIHRCLADLLNASGILIFINPKTILTDSYFSALRSFVLKNSSILSVLNFADRRNVFESVLQACIVNAFVKEKNTNYVKTKSIDNKQQIYSDDFITPEMSQVVVNKPKPIFIISDKIEKYKILEHLFSFPSFEDEGIIFTTGKIQWDLYKEYLSSKPIPNAIRLIWAENIQRYYFKEAQHRADKIYLNFPEITNKFSPIKKATIFVQRTTAIEQEFRIISNLIDPQIFGFDLLSENNSSFIETNRPNLSYDIIQGALSSKIFDFVFRHINSNTHVSAGELNSLPIVIPTDNIQAIIKIIVNAVKYLKSDDSKPVSSHFSNNIISQYFLKILDGIFIELFFQNHMLEKDIAVIDAVFADINNILSDDISKINPSDINALFTVWNERDNKVRNRLILFTSRSENLIKQIYDHKI
ncbi:MAG: Eco57I restriction-modification methylase domain-containing protein [Ignavibacteriaceae bacterium]|jgi:hypothetical protein|nr:Eco57I restriction-modification methylase domain-containing protein [Ignavibacteriaceae bacterium]